MGRRAPLEPQAEVKVDLERARRNLGRKIRLCSPEWVRNNIAEDRAERVGLGDLWRERVADDES